MSKDPRELKAGQFVIVKEGLPSSISIRSGKVVKHITGLPHPSVLISWDNSMKALYRYDCDYPWNCIHVVNTEQEKLALMMKLS